MLFLYIIFLLVSFYLLSQVTDNYFIDSLDRIAKKWNLSHDAAGATLMAVGSSAPELFVSLVAVFTPGGHEEIGMGTIVGSALFNILVIVGAVAIVRKAVIAWQSVIRDLLFYFIAVLMLYFAFRDGTIDFWESVVFVSCFVVYVVVVIKWRKWLKFHDAQDDIEIDNSSEDINELNKLEKVMRPFDFMIAKLFPPAHYYGWVFTISIIIIAFLSWVLVFSAIGISEILNIPEVVVGLTVLAVGTSVPDLMSSVIVAKQGRGGMGISNAIGSNIFDIFIGLGLPWLLAFLILGKEVLPVKSDNLLFSVLLLMASVFLIFLLMVIQRWKIDKRAGWFLVFIYFSYLAWSVWGAVFVF